jgi:LysR family transcriptional regulator, regulator for bpeEF and oprC
MQLFQGVESFVAVVEARSFRGAAAQLKVSAAAVSKAVSALEQACGVQLLNRTTRNVALTSDGALFYERCHEAVFHIRSGREALSSARREPRGRLVVSLSLALGKFVLGLSERWLLSHPEIELEFSGSDRLLALEQEEVDIAIRLGPKPNAAVVAKELGTTQWVSVASPTCISRATRGKPPPALRFRLPNGKPQHWEETEAPSTRLLVNNGEWLLEAALLGLGVCQTLDCLAAPLLREGRLVEVTPSARTPGPSVWALTLPHRRNIPKVRSYIEHLRQAFVRNSAPA